MPFEHRLSVCSILNHADGTSPIGDDVMDQVIEASFS